MDGASYRGAYQKILEGLAPQKVFEDQGQRERDRTLQIEGGAFYRGFLGIKPD